MALKVYHVQGIRHQAVIFAASPEDAVAQAVERGLVGDWERPDAIDVPLPPGYYLAYDPLLAAEQPELPLPLDEPEPEKPHTITRSGVKVYDDWRDNVVVDPDAPPPWSGRPVATSSVPTSPSPDVLTWPVRTARTPSPGTCSARWSGLVTWTWSLERLGWRTRSRCSTGIGPGTVPSRCRRSRRH